jgi:hypothetical protein
LRPLSLLALAFFAACGGSETAAPIVLSISPVGSVPQTIAGAAAGDSLRVRVTDASGAPKSGVSVVFAVTSGGGSISPPTAVTDAQGRAAARFTTGTTVGANSVTATIANASPATFTLTTIAGFAKTLSIKERVVFVDAGQRFVPTITAVDSNSNVVTPSQLLYTTRTPAVVSVTTDGAITGTALSQTFVVAASGSASDSVLVIVTNPNNPALQSDLTRLDLARDTTFVFPVILDMRSAERLGATTVTVRWDPAQLTFVSHAEGATAAGALVNATSVSQGVLTLAVASASGIPGRIELRRLTFKAAATVGKSGTLRITTSEVFAAGTFNDLLARTTSVTYPLSIR